MTDTPHHDNPRPGFDNWDNAPYLEPQADRDDELVLVKQGKRFVFNCPPGHEQSVLHELRRLVADPDSDFTWFDAAVISHQMGVQMSERLNDAYQHRRPA